MKSRQSWRMALVCPAIVVSPTSLPSQAHANDVAMAQSLFDDAKKLVGEGRYADACVKFEQSQKLDPGMGTLFNLADCFEHVGKTASAWAGFLDVAAQAKAATQTQREQAA